MIKVRFLKSFFSIIGVHLLMCILPFFFVSVLNGDPKYTVDTAKSAGQIAVYAIYFILFFCAYFLVGRNVGGKILEERHHLAGIFARVLASLLIMSVGVFVYYYIIVPQRIEEGIWRIFAMPQLMIKRAISDDVVGNKIWSTIAMLLPGIVIWIGYASNGVKRKK